MDFLALPREALRAYWNANPQSRPDGIVPQVEMAFALYGQLKIIEHVPNSLLGLAVSELGAFVHQFLKNEDLAPVVDLYDEVLEWYVSTPARAVTRP